MRRLGLLIVMAGLLSGPDAWADGARFRLMMPYAEARDTFRRLGYQPYVMPGADICDPNDPRCYPEREACARSRTWACTYTWRHGRAIIEVETRYETPVVAHAECIVNCLSLAADRVARTAKPHGPVSLAEAVPVDR